MITKTLNALRGYNGVAKVPEDITINGATVPPTLVYWGGDGVGPDLGAEEVTNGDFALWTDPTVPDDWDKVGVHGASDYVEEASTGGCRFVTTGSIYFAISQPGVLTLSDTYMLTVEVESMTGSFKMISGTNSADILSAGAHNIVWTANNPNVQVFRISGSACDAIITNISVKKINTAGYLPPHAPSGAETLYETGSGAAIDWDVPAYGNGPGDRAVRFNEGTALQAGPVGFGDLGDNDFVKEWAFIWPGDGASIIESKRDVLSGYSVGVTAAGALEMYMYGDTGSAHLLTSPGEIVAGQTVHAAVVCRKSVYAYGYVNGDYKISATTTTVGDLDSAAEYKLGGYGTLGSDISVIYAATWVQSAFVGAGDPSPVVLDRFQKWCDAYPDLAVGTPNPTSLNADPTFIEEYDPADGFISLHSIAEGVLPVGRVRDLAGELFYGYRLAGIVENLIPYSQDIDNASWTKTRCTIDTSGIIESPSPGISMQGIVADAVPTNTSHYVEKAITFTASTYTISAYCKKGSVDWVSIQASGRYCYFDLNNGATGANNNLVDYGIIDMGNDIYRVYITAVFTAATISILLVSGEGDGDDSFTGDGAAISTSIWGIQTEIGTYPNPPILTEGAAIIRNEDSLAYKTDDGAIPDPSKFFLQFEYLNQYGPPVAMHPLCTIGDAVDHEIQIDNGGRIDVNVGELTSVTSITDGYKHKIGLWVDGSHADLYIDDMIEDTTEGFLVASSLVYLLFAVADRGGQQSAPQWVRDVNLYTDNPYLRLYADEAQEGDVLLYQTTDEGEMNIVEGVTEMTPTFDTMFYLSLFGGNEDDPGGSDTTKQWWGNIDEPDPAYQYRSRTQHILRSTNANSTNLKRLENAAIFDLTRDFIDTGIGSDLTVAVSIPRLNRVDISGTINADGETIPFKFTANWEASV